MHFYINNYQLTEIAINCLYWGRKEAIGYLIGYKTEDFFYVSGIFPDQKPRFPLHTNKYASVRFNPDFKKKVRNMKFWGIKGLVIIGDYHSHTFRSCELPTPPEPSTYEDDPDGGDLSDMYPGRLYLIVNRIKLKKPEKKEWHAVKGIYKDEPYIFAEAMFGKYCFQIAGWIVAKKFRELMPCSAVIMDEKRILG